MSTERQKQLIQEALDDLLTPEAQQELAQELGDDVELSAAYERLKQVDRVLRNAPFEHAPQRLALNIMARLAKSVPELKTRVSALALALGLTLVVVVLLPLLVAAGWLILSVMGNAAALSSALQQLTTLLTVVVGVLTVFIEKAQEMVASSPAAPAALLALIPVSIFWLTRNVMGKDSDSDTNDAD
ncbi:MAG: hypothetical protein H6672_21245 [Anaerolineaceae bacterium]|nr:hypothetical protein [Anaerolineaceae bacterium]